ncbi:chloride channel protein [Solilutibacter silvestris]|uniref:Chloride channel protein EriC n=1 Tax=Solilutibacter silvestris TaxID=1645665 RepID=A0A2K1Q3N6_9GAMM|nr:chloride channel protein [Lysobacter silvestris]PNS09611.1 Chloride channel protein EriC [Lysobacter silvestris]
MMDPHAHSPILLASSESWRRRMALWCGAIVVALASILFAKGSDAAFRGFAWLHHQWPLASLALPPAMFGVLSWLTSRGMQATRGSGIPQVIAALEQPTEWREAQLSPKIAFAKLWLTLAGLLGGASIGREGPTVHIGAGLMHWIGRRFGFDDPQQGARFLLAGGAAGIAAAFNTPLAGVVFAIEELGGAFEHRFSGTLLTAVIIGGVVSLGVLGDYVYFGHVSTRIAFGIGWLAVPACGILCGLAGGGFSRALLALTAPGMPVIGTLRQRHPILLAIACGIALSLLGYTCGDGVFGTGYTQARDALIQQDIPGQGFGIAKLLANLVSYLAGIPGGLFSPALSAGAGLGQNLAPLFPAAPASAVVLLGMCGYLSGVTQAPLTSAIITMEMTDSSDMLLPILAVALIARTTSMLVCRMPIYKALALRLLQQSPSTSSPAASNG